MARRDGSVLTKTRSGKGLKPGGSFLKSDIDVFDYEQRNNTFSNLSGKKDVSDNPF